MKIHPQQKKLMKQAGFKQDQFRDIVVWKRGVIRVAFNPARRVNLRTLLDRVAMQCWYHTAKEIQLRMVCASRPDCPTIKFTNEPPEIQP